MRQAHVLHVLLQSLLFLLLTSTTEAAETIPLWDDAMSEGCSLAPDISLQCCIQHDHAYYYGGSARDRYSADGTFRECLRDEDWPVLSWVYYGAVRIGGHPIVPLWFRWGFGSPYAWGQYAKHPATPARTLPLLSAPAR